MSEKSRLKWRCRRGTKELDLIFENFLARGYDSLSAEERQAFERLLEEQDDRLQTWFIGKERPDDLELCRLVERISQTPRG